MSVRTSKRPFNPSTHADQDAEGMFELNQAEDVFRNTGDKPFKDLEEAKKLIRNYDQFTKV